MALHLGSLITCAQPCFFSTLQNTAVFPSHIKIPASPLCILHRSPAVQSLPISVFHLRSTRWRLACSSRSFFHKLHSFRKPPAVSLLPCSTGSAQGCFTILGFKIELLLLNFVLLVTFSKVCILIKYLKD